MQPRGADVGVDQPTAAGGLADAIVTILSASAMATSSQTAAATPTATGSPTQPDEPGECQLLGSFALLVQGALGALALLSLVYKRWRERPQRPVKIWFFDVSKQVFGSVLVHIANIFMSMLTSGRFSIRTSTAVTARVDDGGAYVPNPCSFYLLNLAIDTTIGIPILIGLLRVLTFIVSFTPLGKPSESIQSGNYGSPPNAWWWLKQSVIYFGGLFGMKICVLIIFILMPWISRVGDWALGWTEGNERLQIAFVMMIFPLIMNGLQYYIIDSFIKKKADDDDDGSPARGQGDGLGRYHAPVVQSGDLDDEDSELDGRGQKLSTTANDHEYDPHFDGDEPTVSSSSSSRQAEDRRVPSELLPKE